ncbi:MerR family transcriptional regulator [Roseinatronobacter sp.]
MRKAPEAFRTISETAEALETPAHVLRFWESKFTQVKPVKRAGGRRYYRRADIDLLSGIKELLHEQGMTIRGVQKLLQEKGVRHVAGLAPVKDMTLDDTPTVNAQAAPTPPARFTIVQPHQTQDNVVPDSANMTAPADSSITQPPPSQLPEPARIRAADAAEPDVTPQQATEPAAQVPDAPAPDVTPDLTPPSQPEPATRTADTSPRGRQTSIRLAHDMRRRAPLATRPDAARIAPLAARLEQLLARMTAQAEQANRPHHPS